MTKFILSLVTALCVGATAMAEQPMSGETPPAAVEPAQPAAETTSPEVTAEEMPTAAESETVPTPGTVARAVFTTAVVDREPVDQITTADQNTQTVYFFTELRDMEGQTVTHRWLYNGTIMAEVGFDVGGARWRVYSSKNFVPEWVGQWSVEVVDANGQIRESADLDYVAAR